MPKAVNGIKYCSSKKCTEVNPQPTSNFDANQSSHDGLSYECKTCRAMRRNDPEYKAGFNEYMRVHSKTKQWKEANSRYRNSEKGKATARARKNTPKYKQQAKKYSQSEAGRLNREREIQSHPERRKARIAVANAVRDGKLPRVWTRQCTYCPKQAQQYHHHNGYEHEHRLDVIPVCIKCHNLLAKFGTIPNNDALSSVTLQ